MKILAITDRVEAPYTNGADVFCGSLLRALAHRHRVTVLHHHEGSRHLNKCGKLTLLGMPDMSTRDGGEALAEIKRLVNPQDYDVVYNVGCGMFGCKLVTVLALQSSQRPIVNHFQVILGEYARVEGTDDASQGEMRSLQTGAIKRATANIFPSLSSYQEALSQGMLMHAGLASIVPNGVDLGEAARTRRNGRRLHDVQGRPTSKPFTFFTAGRFSDLVKGADLVYRAFHLLYQERQDVFLLAVCDSDRFLYLLEDLPRGAYARMDWLPRTEFLSLMAASDAIVVPSRHEAFGMVAIEAMMLGRPVLANSVGGLQEIVCHDRTGLINEPEGGSWGLYQMMRSIAEKPHAAKRMGRAAKIHVAAEYDIGRVAELVERDLKRAIRVFHSLANVGGPGIVAE